MTALVPVFTLRLNQKVVPGLVTAGKFDGSRTSLAAATSGGKVLIHSPHNRLATVAGNSPFPLATSTASDRVSVSSAEGDDVTLLSFGQRITSLTAGNIQPGTDNDVLMIGSQTNLLVYDVRENCDLFYKDLHDGANTMLVGRLGRRSDPLLFVGGNCSVQGFDHRGEDQYWTVTGDNVCCMALGDYNSDGRNELVVGSEDYDIRVFEDDDLVNELTEADAVIALCHLHGNRFGYALANGIVGVYGGPERFWRIKSKNHPLVLYSYDIDGDGVPELITGWSNGKVDARSSKTGDVLYKDSFPSAIAGIIQADYRMDGKEELICCSVDGEIRGYLPGESVQKRPLNSDPGSDPSPELRSLEELNRKRQNLLLELKNFEMNEKVAMAKDPKEELSRAGPVGVIPAGTLLKTEFSTFIPTPGGDPSEKTPPPHIELSVETSNDTILRSLVIFAEGLFDGESHIVHPPHGKLSNSITFPLFPERDTPVDLNIKAYVGNPNSSQFHVFEAVRPLTRFALYLPCSLSVEPQPAGSVVFHLSERLERFLSWVNDNFMYGPSEHAVTSPYLHLAYLSLRTGTPLLIKMDPRENGQVTLCTDDMDLAGDIVQSLATYLNIEDLEVVAHFPRQMEDLQAILSRVEEFKSVRQKLTAEMADNSGVIRNLVVRAEDARIMDDMVNMRKAYQQLYQLNRDLIMGYQIRSNNHLELLECLRTVNQAIQKAGKLRVGKPKARVIAGCREAVKNSDTEALVRAIKFGSALSGKT